MRPLADEFEGLERFEIRRPLGTGGVGLVYEALDRESGEVVAIKTLHDVTPEGLYRLKREFRLLAGLEHPNLCQHYELFEHDGRWFITMELVAGDDLLHYVRGDVDRLRDAMGQLGAALCALHDAGLVHRDLKPSNVMVTPEGRVVVLDFGFVEGTGPELDPERSQSIVGTPVYMAPEQAVAADVGPPADWYSFGVILFEALTDRIPHDGQTALAVMLAKQRSDAPAPSTLAAGVPRDLDALCVDLLRADPAARPPGRKVVSRIGAPASRDSRPSLASMTLGAGFVGRTAELAALHRALADLDRGRPVTVLIEGASGVGKTALVRQFSEEALATGALVLGGGCVERESVPYKAFDSAIDALARHLRRLGEAECAALLPRHPDLLVRMFPVLGAVRALATAPATRAPVSDPQEQRNQAFAALREVLHRLASRRRLVVTIDDWQWADADSVVLARDLVRHRDSPPMLMVLTSRPAEDAETAARIGAIVGGDAAQERGAAGSSSGGPAFGVAGELRRIPLETLIEAQAIELARQLARAFAPQLDLDVVAIARDTGGHPLYISELVRYAATRGGADATAIRLEEVVVARIDELGDEARVIAEALAVAREPLPVEVLRDVVDLSPAVLQRQIAVLRLAHLVKSGQTEGVLEPYHDRVRRAVLDAMSAERRLDWHRRIAFAIEASPLARERPELLLGHFEAAGHGDRAAAVAVTAAQRAVVAGAFDQAASLFGVALRCGAPDEQRSRALRIAMGGALANAGRAHEAAAAFLAAAEGADPATRLDCHRQAAEQLLMIGDLERGLDILRTLLGDVGVRVPGTQKRALASVLWGRTKLWARGLRWKERRASQIAPETLLRLDVLKAASHGLSMVDNVRAADFNVRWLWLALRTGERTRCAFALATEIVFLGSQGGRGGVRALALLEIVRRLGAEGDDPRLRAFLLMSEGTVEYWACRLVHADDRLSRAEAVFRYETTGTNLELKNTRMFLAFTLRHRGEWARLRLIREEYVVDAERRGDRYVLTSMNRYCNSLWLAADDPAEARRRVDDASWVPPASAFHVQHWYELEARGEIAIYEGSVAADRDKLESLFDGLEHSVLLRIQTIRALALWLRGRLGLVDGDADGARVAARMVARLVKIDDARAQVAARLLRAGLAARRGNAEAVAAALRDADAVATAHDMALHAAAARYQLGHVVGGTEGAALMSDAETVMSPEGIASPARFARWFVPGVGSGV